MLNLKKEKKNDKWKTKEVYGLKSNGDWVARSNYSWSGNMGALR